MGATDKFFSAVKEVLILSNEVKRLADEVKEMEANQRDIDRRVVRLETMVEIAQTQETKRLT
ncbi:MAG: hypothetical protein ACR2P1_00015 [Pseudomonadales bacterium]